jgi:dipeptidyl aminopeptidase/acylaminoacyl peptidase
MTQQMRAYGTWPSPIGADLVASTQISLSAPTLTADGAWWCEGRPAEAGRVVLMHRSADGTVREVTPKGFNVRTRVHEYGGRAYAVADGMVVAVDFASQRLHRLGNGGTLPLTPDSGSALRYADFLIDRRGGRVIAVREDHRRGGEPENTLVAVPLGGEAHEGIILNRGHDFCAAPALSPDCRRLAWITWDHPDMPWDATALWAAGIGADGALQEPRRVAGGAGESVLQPLWLQDGSLVFASDRSGWWNLWRWDGAQVTCLAPAEAEFAGALWSIGTRWFDQWDAGSLAVTVSREGSVRLGRLELTTGRLTLPDLPVIEAAEPSCAGGAVLLLASEADCPPALWRVGFEGRPEVVRRSGELAIDPTWISHPRSIWFPGTDGKPTQAFYYPPTSPESRAPAGTLPPLIVRSHGGPTARAGGGLSLALQFWTSRGFAVVDVNYGGSTGFGRDYRQRLDGRWGIVDVEDCIAAARHLVAEGLADPDRLIIRGGSASGYTTLCALTFHEVFKAGASYYGIGDLEALARDTHKFEARYLDRLIGPWPERSELYRARSPIHHVDRLSCPVIFFQGQQDLAVPPNQAEAMVAALRAKRLPVAYLSFPDEGHGFRKAETIRTCLEAEHAFFCRVFGLSPEGGTAAIEIENVEG